MKVYLDVCCWNRPFDGQSQNRVRLEAEAVLSILEMAQSHELEVVSSDIVDGELSEMTDDEKREKVGLLLKLASLHVALTAAMEKRAGELQKWNLAPLDALHLAAAESAMADCFLTTDDDLLRKAKRASLKVKIENPAKWLIQEAMDED